VEVTSKPEAAYPKQQNLVTILHSPRRAPMSYSGDPLAPLRQAEAVRHALPAAAAPQFAPSYRSHCRPRHPPRLACARGLPSPSAAAAPPHIHLFSRGRPHPPPFYWTAGVGTRTVSSCPGKEPHLICLLGGWIWLFYDYKCAD
jgi:hypothetical protein